MPPIVIPLAIECFWEASYASTAPAPPSRMTKPSATAMNERLRTEKAYPRTSRVYATWTIAPIGVYGHTAAAGLSCISTHPRLCGDPYDPRGK